MNARAITPVVGPLDAVVTVPGSKSIANRALVCAALADGSSKLGNLPDGDDTAAMVECLGLLGITVEPGAASAVVHGRDGILAAGPLTLSAKLAGTTSRFLTAVAALGPGPYVIDGDGPLRNRPMGPLHDALAALGAVVEPMERPGHLPVRITAGSAPTTRPTVRVRGDVSSQYITALMLIAPRLEHGLRLELTTELVSRPYVEMTAAVMASFGYDGVTLSGSGGADVIELTPGGYAAREYLIEPDASSASYPLAAAAIVGGRVRVEGMVRPSLQGDAEFANVLARMGCHVAHDAAGTAVSRTGPLHGVTVDMRNFSDCAPTMAVVAAVAASPTRVTGIGFIRGKESDRIGDVVEELRRCGIEAEAEPDGFVVRPGTIHGARVHTYHDHRVAMSFALLGLMTPGISIEDPGVVSKSFPAYWQLLDQLSHERSHVAWRG